MANPKILYTPAGGSEQTLNFVSPPSQQPGYLKAALRHDNISTAGIQESVLERIDRQFEIHLEWIRTGADLQNWGAFLDHALTGAPFAYYPDASQSAYVNGVLVETETRIDNKAPGIYALTLRFRENVS